MNGTFVIGTITAFSVLAPVLAGAFAFRKLDRGLKTLWALFLVVTLVEAYAGWQFLVGGNPHWAHHIYTPVEYSLFMIATLFWLGKSVIRRAILFSIPAFILINIAAMIMLRDFSNLNGFTQSLACVLYVPVAAFMLFGLLKHEDGLNFAEPRFWIFSGLLLYGAGGLGYFAFSNLPYAHLSYYTWLFHSAINFLANLLYAIGFICQYRR